MARLFIDFKATKHRIWQLIENKLGFQAQNKVFFRERCLGIIVLWCHLPYCRFLTYFAFFFCGRPAIQPIPIFHFHHRKMVNIFPKSMLF